MSKRSAVFSIESDTERLHYRKCIHFWANHIKNHSFANCKLGFISILTEFYDGIASIMKINDLLSSTLHSLEQNIMLQFSIQNIHMSMPGVNAGFLLCMKVEQV